MIKQPVNPNWFSHLWTANLWGSFEWLLPLSGSVETVVSFGCSSSEPLALLWILDATEVKVIEKEEERLIERRQELAVLTRQLPSAFEGRSVEFIAADMSLQVNRLPSEYFDLAFCRDVLYQIHLDAGLERVQDAIAEMTRVVRPGGWIAACYRLHWLIEMKQILVK